MTTFYAQPYSIDHTGFYFEDIAEYDAGMEKLNARGCEEVEIQFIDGDTHLAQLANNAGIGQGQVSLWFEYLEDLDENETERLGFLLDCGYSLEDALDRYEDVLIFEGSASDYAYDLISEISDVPEHLRHYIDYDAIARDMELSGEITEIGYQRIIINASEF